MIRALACILFVACSSPAPAPTTPTPPPTGSDTGSGSGSDTTPTTTGLGEKCDGNPCAKGQSCVHYFGIAGASGPELTSCEISCAGDAPCPAGTKCITIADGPGQVCRP